MERKQAIRLVGDFRETVWRHARVFFDTGLADGQYDEFLNAEELAEHGVIDALCNEGWIPLTEDLPEPNETVEIWLPNNSYVKIAPANFHILGTGVKVFSGVTTYSLKEVSHFRRIVGPREESCDG